MTTPPDRPDAAPIAETTRIDSIDVLRGFALLGILVMNVQSFAMPQAAYFNPTAYGDLEGANLYVWLAGRMLADQKFMTIFSMLFGAGIVLMAGRAEARGGTAGRVHYRRMGWLLVIGLLHAHLLWYGDILFIYAVCGMVLYPLRRLSPGQLIALGTTLLAVGSALSVGVGMSLPYWPEEALSAFTADAWRPAPEALEAELAVYRGGWLGQLPSRSADALAFETFLLVTWGFWRAGGLMLIGMGLFHREVFGARRSPRFYAGLIAAAVVVGLPLQAYGLSLDFARGWPVWSFFLGHAVQLLAEHRGQPRLGRARDARLPVGVAPPLHPSVRRRRADGPDELPAPDRPLHDDLLRPRARLVRIGRPRGADRRGGRRLGAAARRLAALAAPVPLRSRRVGLAVSHLRRAPDPAANRRPRARGLTSPGR